MLYSICSCVTFRRLKNRVLDKVKITFNAWFRCSWPHHMWLLVAGSGFNMQPWSMMVPNDK